MQPVPSGVRAPVASGKTTPLSRLLPASRQNRPRSPAALEEPSTYNTPVHFRSWALRPWVLFHQIAACLFPLLSRRQRPEPTSGVPVFSRHRQGPLQTCSDLKHRLCHLIERLFLNRPWEGAVFRCLRTISSGGPPRITREERAGELAECKVTYGVPVRRFQALRSGAS